MKVLNTNTTGKLMSILNRTGNDGNLVSPDTERNNNFTRSTILPKYALDNGRFIAWSKGDEWKHEEYISLLEWATGNPNGRNVRRASPTKISLEYFILTPSTKIDSIRVYDTTQKINSCRVPSLPMWAIVPDVVTDIEATKKEWLKYAPIVRSYGLKLAFAVQDGATKEDVPHDADIVFVGGSKQWKWETAKYWCDNFPRVHIGGVNSLYGEKFLKESGLRNGFIYSKEIGAESVDGSGITKNPKQKREFISFVTEEYLYTLFNIEEWDKALKSVYEVAMKLFFLKKKTYTKEKERKNKKPIKN